VINRLCIRTFDLCIAASGLIILSPFFLVFLLAVKADSNGPAFFNQARLGLRGKEFIIHKFRTMTVEASSDISASWVSGVDCRITRVGRLLRRYHLDELPQLFNVLKGDMSLVGPRPYRASVSHEISKVEPRWEQRLQFKPGITGPAQLFAGRGENIESHAAKLAFDLTLRKLSTRMYLQLCLKTLGKIASGSSY